jgi:hypothetical protein
MSFLTAFRFRFVTSPVPCSTDAISGEWHDAAINTPNPKDRDTSANLATRPAKAPELTPDQLEVVRGGIIT